MGMFDNLNEKMKGALAGLTNLQSGNANAAVPSAPADGTVCSCGAELAAGAKFCPSCGKPTTCANCGAQLGGAKFCPSCGTPAGGAASPQPPQSPTAPPPPPQSIFAPPQPATEKVGNIRKCAACGAEVPAMAAICPTCGHEFSNVQAAATIQSLFERLNQIQEETSRQIEEMDKRAAQKSGGSGVLGGFFGRLNSGADDPDELAQRALARRVQLIEGFPIPNSKEDIMEFIILASSRIKKKQSTWTSSTPVAEINENNSMSAAWMTKCKQAYAKAKIVLGADKDALQLIEQALKDNKVKL